MISHPVSPNRLPPLSGEPTDHKEPLQGGPEEAADYISAAAGDLVKMARRHGLDTLGFVLEMAVIEADEIRLRRIQARK